jgi:phage recombination protein Bet
MSAVTAWAPPTRLAFPDKVSDRFQIDAIKWKALVETIYPNAASVDSIIMALSYCEARRLDPFKRPVHIVPVWSKALNKMVDTVWPGISELRTTAMRTAVYAGKDKTQFGPDITADLGGVSVTYPEWAQTTVYRVVPGVGRCAFEGPEVSWIESYARAGRDTAKPNDMWLKRPRGQLDKCAEAAALA